MLSNIRLICFDLDDTLWPCTPTIRRAEQAIYVWLAENRPRITQRYTIDQLRDKRLELYQRRADIAHDLSELRKVSLRELADECQYDQDWIEPAFEVFYRYRQMVDFYDDVAPVLSALKQRYTLASVTNGNADVYLTELGHLFSHALSAADVGKAKPNPAVFEQLLMDAGVSSAETLHVGDHPVHDIVGAQAAGIRTVWLSRDDKEWQHNDYQPDFIISNLHQLLEAE